MERTVPAKATEPGVMTVPLSRQSSRLEQVSGGQPRAEKVSTGGGGQSGVSVRDEQGRCLDEGFTPETSGPRQGEGVCGGGHPGAGVRGWPGPRGWRLGQAGRVSSVGSRDPELRQGEGILKEAGPA